MEVELKRFRDEPLIFEGKFLMEVKSGRTMYTLYKIAYTNIIVVGIDGDVPPNTYLCKNFNELAETLSYIDEDAIEIIPDDIMFSILNTFSE